MELKKQFKRGEFEGFLISRLIKLDVYQDILFDNQMKMLKMMGTLSDEIDEIKINAVQEYKNRLLDFYDLSVDDE